MILKINSATALRILGAAVAAMLTVFVGCSTVDRGVAGASGEVKGSVQDVQQRTQSVFKSMKLHVTNTQTQDSGREQTLGGSDGNENVTVNLSSSSDNTTHVVVTAKKGALDWDKDYANQVLSKIVQS